MGCGQAVGSVAGGIIGAVYGEGNWAAGAAIGGAIGGAVDSTQQGAAVEDESKKMRGRHEEDQARRLALASSPEELAQLQQAIDLNGRDIQRRTELLNSSDPALIEAGHQTLAMLRGDKEAGSLSIIRRQREQGRAKLQERLRRQLGNGAETSSAGIEALNRYDQSTDESLQGAQQASLGQLLGVSQDTSARYGHSENARIAGTLGGLYGSMANRRVGAFTGRPIGTISPEFYGNAVTQGQQQNSLGQLIGGVGSLVGSGIFNSNGSSGGSADYSGGGGAASQGSVLQSFN